MTRAGGRTMMMWRRLRWRWSCRGRCGLMMLLLVDGLRVWLAHSCYFFLFANELLFAESHSTSNETMWLLFKHYHPHHHQHHRLAIIFRDSTARTLLPEKTTLCHSSCRVKKKPTNRLATAWKFKKKLKQNMNYAARDRQTDGRTDGQADRRANTRQHDTTFPCC